MPIKAVIFDLDGTITEPFFDFDAMRSEMGLTGEDGPIWEAMEKMAPERRREAERILDYHENLAVSESTLNLGAKETLEQLRQMGIFIGVLTRNKKCNASAVAEKHGLFFDAVLGREEGPVKPDAFGVLRLCEKFGIEPGQTIMVGDFLFDIQCANAAGAVSVLLKNHHRADEFAEQADFVIENLGQILDIIGQVKRTLTRK
ncbi:MAG: HAD family hydrolase [Candidatus Brocadiia bacterium]|nr:MAG: HAD family hydrolase [Candidatus Brocadiia bacterium]